MNCPRWVWSAEGARSAAFSSKFDCVENAAEELELSEVEVFGLVADGWLPYGKHGSITVCNENDLDC